MRLLLSLQVYVDGHGLPRQQAGELVGTVSCLLGSAHVQVACGAASAACAVH